MKAILINPSATPAVQEVEIGGELAEAQKLVGGYIEMIRLGAKDAIFIDEDWNNKDPKKRFSGSFEIGAEKYGKFTIGGRGLIVGIKGSGNTDTSLNLLKASQLVTVLSKV
jgi:hypothetical protein